MGKTTATEPVIPPGAIDAILRACFGSAPSFGPTLSRIALLQRFDELRELHLGAIEAGIARSQDSVRLALDTAALGAETASPAGQLSELVRFTERPIRRIK